MGLKRQDGYDYLVWVIPNAKLKIYPWKMKIADIGGCSLMNDLVQ